MRLMGVDCPPMDVTVDSNRGGRPRSAAKLSFMGEGLLERARSTILALLGAVVAIGLAAVALALNQDWPLLPDSPLPAERPVAVEPGPAGSGPPGPTTGPGGGPAAGGSGRGSSAIGPDESGDAPAPPPRSSFVGAERQSVGTSSPAGGAPGKPSQPTSKPPRPGPKPQSTAQPVSNPAPAPRDSSASPAQPAAEEAEAAGEPAPEATASSAPENGKAWGWGKGEARGHDHDRGWGRDDDDGGWDRDDDHHGGWGHGREHGH